MVMTSNNPDLRLAPGKIGAWSSSEKLALQNKKSSVEQLHDMMGERIRIKAELKSRGGQTIRNLGLVLV